MTIKKREEKKITFEAFLAQMEIFSANMAEALNASEAYAREKRLDGFRLSPNYDKLHQRYARQQKFKARFDRATEQTSFPWLIKISQKLEMRALDTQLAMYERLIPLEAVQAGLPLAMQTRKFSAYAKDLSLTYTARLIDMTVEDNKRNLKDLMLEGRISTKMKQMDCSLGTHQPVEGLRSDIKITIGRNIFHGWAYPKNTRIVINNVNGTTRPQVPFGSEHKIDRHPPP